MANPQQDTWVDVKQPTQNQGQDEWQDVSHGNVNVPSDVVATPNPGSHPTYSPQQENPGTSFIKGLYQGGVDLANEAKGIQNRIIGTDTNGMTPAQIDELNKPPVPNPMFNGIRNIPDAQPGTISSLAQNAGQGLTGSAPIAGMSPFIGMPAAFAVNKGLEDYSQNKGALQTGADMGIAGATGYGLQLASGLGSSLTKGASDLVSKYAPWVGKASENVVNRAGSALGGGVGAGITSGNNPIAIAQGAGLSTIAPQKPLSMSSLNPVSQIQSYIQSNFPPNMNDLINKEGAPLYAKQIKAPSSIINRLEVKNNKDIDDSYKLAASMGLPLHTSMDGKTQDNLVAIQQVKQAVSPLYKQLSQIYGQNKNTIPGQGGFDLEDLKTQVKRSFDDPNSSSYIPPGKSADANVMKGKVDDLIDAEINRQGVGRYVDAATLNQIKQGMWGHSYTAFSPIEDQLNAQAARQIGFHAKDALEGSFPTDDVKGLNAKAGQYLTLQSILEQQHGKPIATNAIKPMTIPIVHGASRAIGAGVGALVGHMMPGAEGAGPWAGLTIGGEIGNKIAEGIKERANSRENLTSAWAQKLNAAKLAQQPMGQSSMQQPMGQSRNPNVMNATLVPRGITGSMNPVSGTIGYDSVGAYGASRMQGEGQPIVTPPPGKPSGFPINQTPNPGALALPYNYTPIRTGNFEDIRPMEQGKRQFGQERPSYNSGENVLRGPSASSMNPINNLPEFKNTEEALKFGNNNPHLANDLKNKYQQGLVVQRIMMNNGDESGAFMASQKNQLYREAYESATKTGASKNKK